jgi:hypothetical protein
MTSLADNSGKVPKLKRKKYRDYELNEQEWDLLAIVLEVLKVSFLNPDLCGIL